MFKVFALSLVLSSFVFATDIPGGLTKSAESLPVDTYELMLSPGYTIRPSGAYLSTEIRYQPNEDFGAGLGFGAGEVGFNFGLQGSWYILPDDGKQPSVSILGGLYFNRIEQLNYFAVRVTPTISKNFKMSWGRLTPYAGLHITPSFRLGVADNALALKTSVGAEAIIKDWSGIRLIAEAGLNLANSVSEVMLGVGYPFAALGS